jgi:hypothetical protein
VSALRRLNAASGGDNKTVSLHRRADVASRLVVRSEFTTALRGTAMENSPTHLAPVETASPSQGR